MSSTLALISLAAIAAASTSGCGKSHNSGYHDPITIQSGGQDRTYGIDVPANYDPSNSYPLIIDYHGRGQTSADQRLNSMYYTHAAGQQYLLVYPQGVDNAWESASYANPDVDDLQFTSDLVAHLESDYCIDTQRIYASGKSNGGGFVDLLACSDNGDAFAAFAMASPALYSDNSEDACGNYSRAILESHGLEDTTIPYDGEQGATGGNLPSIEEWGSWWGQRDCGDQAVTSTQQEDGYNLTTISCPCWSTDVVQRYVEFDLGHCWPSSTGDNYDSQNGNNCGDRALAFTTQVLNFFAQWNLDNAPPSC